MSRHSRDPASPDLLSLVANTPAERDPSGSQGRAAATSVLLPTDLAASLAILNDTEFDRLLAGVIHEASRRQKPVPVPPDPKPAAASVKATREERNAEGVTQAKGNLVRAAFEVGVKPAAISRQFGLSQATIRQVL